MGWIFSRNKSKLGPKRQITFLGRSWNTESMPLQTTKLMRKQIMAALIKQAQLLLQQRYQTVRSVTRLIGLIQYIRVQYTRGGLHITSMNREMSKRAKIAGWDSPIKLSRRALIEVEWWLAQIKNNRPKNIETHKTQAIITTDVFLGRWGSNLINTGIGHTENIQTMESENPNIEQKRNNCNLIRTELFLANIATQPLVIPEGKDRQYNSVLQLNQRQSQSRIEKISRLDPSIHRGIIMGSQVQAHSRNQQHRSGFAIEARSFGRLLNRQINAIASARRMGDLNYSQLLHNKEKYKTSQVPLNRK
ncbi:MAG: hypothetical protein EZS28_039466 [Streblomastix strix]|uniref:Uncharacterized protein n=1 Tax=Streblomastix strix TaxID=222440 RepID=A0A5J4U3X4_9EUKA|nr:MAG: hypothetical protein EZS28_039466 [Streblomastix strix]